MNADFINQLSANIAHINPFLLFFSIIVLLTAPLLKHFLTTWINWPDETDNDTTELLFNTNICIATYVFLGETFLLILGKPKNGFSSFWVASLFWTGLLAWQLWSRKYTLVELYENKNLIWEKHKAPSDSEQTRKFLIKYVFTIFMIANTLMLSDVAYYYTKMLIKTFG